jgi:hypothetical protein
MTARTLASDAERLLETTPALRDVSRAQMGGRRFTGRLPRPKRLACF